MTRYIDEHKDQYGVEPICRTLEIAPSTYYAARSRLPSARQRRDEELKPKIGKVHADNYDVYGAEKVWRQLLRESVEVGRDRTARLMAELGLSGITRSARRRTTVAAETAPAQPGDLVDRNFSAAAPNRLWVADLTYVSTWAGFCYVAFVIDAFSRRIVGWRVSTSLRAELALDALEMAIWSRQGDTEGLVHHSDRGVQYLAIRYTERLEEAGAVASVGSRGDSYDNALAETVNGLYKAELIRRRGPWRTADQVELATAAWVEWWNQRRLHSTCGYMPPAEYEAMYYREQDAANPAA
jgi:putative transposase